jgi:protein TonB
MEGARRLGLDATYLENDRIDMQPQSSDVTRIRVGPMIQAQRLAQAPQPEYPAAAKEGKIQGTVTFGVIIDKTGHVRKIQLVSGHPMLAAAAAEAVQKYVYEPTLLNGEPVEVNTNVDVVFTLPN